MLAVGKASGPMRSAFLAGSRVPVRHLCVIGTEHAGHPLPDERSVAAARRALDAARAAGEHDLLVVLLSGGASALMALPVDGVTLDDKQRTVRMLLEGGADITDLNTVRKHLSKIKGGQLAAASRGSTLTLAVSDVVGDDLAVIGSGPTVADPTTWQDAIDVLDRWGGRRLFPAAVVSVLERGLAGALPDTPKADDPRLERSEARVIGGRGSAIDGARRTAETLGYHVHVMEAPVVGEARVAARTHLDRVAQLAAAARRPLCVLAAGETTVRVTGKGRGGRNQEFALALAPPLSALGANVAVASVGTDGVDGPTDAAGAVADSTTLARAAARGLGAPSSYLDENNSYVFFQALGDLVRLGPTNTNVGDLQVVLVGE